MSDQELTTYINNKGMIMGLKTQLLKGSLIILIIMLNYIILIILEYFRNAEDTH